MSRFVHLFNGLHSHSVQPCIAVDGVVYTYAYLLEEVQRWQSRFDELNVTAGSVVGMRADYSLASISALLSLCLRHAVVAMIPRSQDATLYLEDGCAEALLDLNVNGSYEWHPISPPVSHPLLEQLRIVGEGGVIIFTSGSTGRPKAALQSLERFMYKYDKPARALRTLGFLLFDHVAGLETLFFVLSSGGTLILTRRRDPASIVQLIEAQKVEALPASPSFLRLLCAAGVDKNLDLSSLKIITYSSEPMDHSTLIRLNALFPNAQISQKYGATETSGAPRNTPRGNDSLWFKIKREAVETKIIDGILWIRSEGTMLGYLNAPSPFDEEGWYCTGDLVETDGEWIRVLGRASDIINVGGEKVAPAEVEQSILELDFVREVLVSGEPHPLMGHIVTARVVLKSTAPNPKEAIKSVRTHCRKRLPPHKIPVNIRIATESLVNDRQKVQRNSPSKDN